MTLAAWGLMEWSCVLLAVQHVGKITMTSSQRRSPWSLSEAEHMYIVACNIRTLTLNERVKMSVARPVQQSRAATITLFSKHFYAIRLIDLSNFVRKKVKVVRFHVLTYIYQNMFWFLWSVTVNQTFEDFFLGFGKHWWTFFAVFSHFIDRKRLIV